MTRLALGILLLVLAAGTLYGQADTSESSSRFNRFIDLFKQRDLPTSVTEADQILPPGTMLDSGDVSVYVGEPSDEGWYFATGLLLRSDSLVVVLVKFEGGESRYRDIYHTVAFSMPGGIRRSSFEIARFADTGEEKSTSEATIGTSLETTTIVLREGEPREIRTISIDGR